MISGLREDQRKGRCLWLSESIYSEQTSDGKELECPECGKFIEVTTLLRPRRGRKPGSINATPLTHPIPPKTEKKSIDLDIDNLDLNSDTETLDDDSVLIEDDNDIDPATDVGIKPTEENKEDL